MIRMNVDAALSEVPVNLVPLTDDTDFKSIETSVAYNASGMALYWHFVTIDGSYTATAVTPTTGGAYDWAHQQQGMYTIEIPASGGASINNDTEGFGWFTGFATGVLPWRGPTIQFSPAAVTEPDVVGSEYRRVDVRQFVGGNATASSGRPEVNTTHAAGTAWGSGAITAGSIASDAITAAKVAADVHQETIELAFTYNATADYAGATSGSLVKEIADNAGGSSLTAADIADAVWDEAIAAHNGSGSTGEALAAAGGAGDPWITALPGSYSAGQAGYIVGTYIDAAITSRMATYTQPTGFLAATFPSTVASTTNITGGTITTVTNLTNAPTAGDFTATMKTSIGTAVAASAVASVTGNVGGNVVGSVGSLTTNNDKTGYTLSATGSAAMTEGYAALGAAGTLPQILYEIRALLAEKSISSTTLTTKKLDGSTTAATYTLDDATTPSAITRAT